MKKFKKIIISFCISILIFGFVSCQEENKGGINEGLLVIWSETILGSSGPYDSACQNPSESSILPLSAPVSITGNSKRYRMTTGPNGLKYSFTLSADYPACGVNLIIKNCLRPNIRATDSLVSCNQGTYSNYVSGGTQTCTIPSFANQQVLILIEPNSDQYPNISCATITFEALP
ncbi:hypothetical protein [Leptospira adleri]|uniref:Lipoprotein n=1 Tax=Leptospira adleri TaxID=2023186 RepID=A0A2M9YJ16_9LEPT|nr:hypothetical protein [Leptospira adleri]PJZ51532.1 hypothetical protein CH380_19805 [Leptospira adleri]PJZ60255.1 hypothetical protein CH376_19325 [Leptospira adleri]